MHYYTSNDLTEKTKINSIVLLRGSQRGVVNFRITLKVKEEWVNLKGLTVKCCERRKEEQNCKLMECDGIQIFIDDGTITLKRPIFKIQLEFNTVSNVQSIRLDVTKANPENNNEVLEQLIPNFKYEGSKFLNTLSCHRRNFSAIVYICCQGHV